MLKTWVYLTKTHVLDVTKSYKIPNPNHKVLNFDELCVIFNIQNKTDVKQFKNRCFTAGGLTAANLGGIGHGSLTFTHGHQHEVSVTTERFRGKPQGMARPESQRPGWFFWNVKTCLYSIKIGYNIQKSWFEKKLNQLKLLVFLRNNWLKSHCSTWLFINVNKMVHVSL